MEAAALLTRATTALAPSHWKAELASVVWKAVVNGWTDLDHGRDVLRAADRSPILSVDVGELWQGALARAVEARHSVYDTLFVELAVREAAVVASYDRSLRRRFPEFVLTPAAVLQRTGPSHR